ncbi:hypothetical protein J3F84DRAFT_354405 [Trichoderma pleuroticola]
MVRVTKVLKRPFIAVQQAWEDYRVGRAIRQMPTIVAPCLKEECKEKRYEAWKKYNEECKNETLNECEEECEEKHSSFNKDECKDKARSQPVRDKERAAQKAAQLKSSWKHYQSQDFPT